MTRPNPGLRALAIASTLFFAFAATGASAFDGDEIAVPDRPFLNDLKCLALSPYYVPRNTAVAWWGYQKELATFFDPSARYPSGRAPSTAEKVGFATVVMPLAAIGTIPVALEEAAVTPFFGHTVDLFTSPFGKPLRFNRLDGSSFR